ncbi:MAG: helix-turn-helix domain-containing protein [Dehalococcoidia bacterium]
MSNQDERLTLTVPEAAKLLGIGRQTAYEAVRTGVIPVIRFGRVIRVPRRALERLLANAGEDIDDQRPQS